ncbi:MAG: isocitrate lyase/phosphoenolpyruvate mutase family protein [Actinomycetota bacterium]|nr:isocitrate lyase/phosphoenolpyruvate mutase family protein [Actinomycetota bacterium]
MRDTDDVRDLRQVTEHFRSMHSAGSFLVLPNAWDVRSALMVEASGFKAVATSSAAVAAAQGCEDTNSMPPDEAFGAIARIAQAIAVPVTGDIEAGYGLSGEEIVRRLIDSRASGCNLEDTDHERGGLVPLDLHCQRIAGFRGKADRAQIPLWLNARVDGFSSADDARGIFDDAVSRAIRYIEAGADSVYPIGLKDPELIGRFVEQVDAPVNILAGTDSDIESFRELGVRRVSFGSSLFRLAYGVFEQKLGELSP